MTQKNTRRKYVYFQRTALAAALAMTVPVAHGFQIDTGNPDLRVRWDNTLKYSAAARVEDRSDYIISRDAFNGDDGNRNFDKGLISNRLDLLSEMDVIYGDFGARVSGAAWYDTVYNEKNDNDSPGTVNHISTSHNEFSKDTRDLHGRKAELLDAFLFGRFYMGESRATVRLGRHSQLWGESLFFGDNGIAGGMAPIDLVKAISVPNTQFKELVRPTGQVSAQLQVNPTVSVGAYYQYEWEESRIPATGSYFEASELAGEGTERYFFGPFGVGTKGSDMDASDSGQYGFQVRFQVGETDYGVYATRYHAKTPAVYWQQIPGAGPGGVVADSYYNVYAEDIKAYGASFSHTFGYVNLAGEVSVRRNMPLASDAQPVAPGVIADNDKSPLYAVGNSAHAQLSWIASLPRNFIAEDSSFLGEIAWNRVTSVTKNANARNPHSDRDAVSIRMIYEPKYYQVMPGLDLSVPMGVGYGIGNSSVSGAFLGDDTGNLNIGLSGTYLQAWRFSTAYTHFFGSEGAFAEQDATGIHASYKQSLADRDFVSFSLSRTF